MTDALQNEMSLSVSLSQQCIEQNCMIFQSLEKFPLGFAHSQLAFLVANEFLNDLDVFMRSCRATANTT